MKRSQKIQAWLAERVSWVQHPHIRPADGNGLDAPKNSPLIKPAPPKTLWSRVPFLVKLLILLILAIPVSLILLFLAYLVLTIVLPYQA